MILMDPSQLRILCNSRDQLLTCLVSDWGGMPLDAPV